MSFPILKLISNNMSLTFWGEGGGFSYSTALWWGEWDKEVMECW